MPQDCCILSRAARLFRLRCAFIVSVVLSVVPCLVPITASRAQERVRTAAAQLEIESFRKPETFVRIGPFQEELTGYTGIEFTDNASLTHTGKLSRFSFFEGFNLNTIWSLSHINQLEFNFGGKLSEDFYGNGRSNLNFSIAPDSLLQFNFAVSDLQVRLYDHFSYTQDPTTNPVATNTAYLNSLNNVIGGEVKKDLNLAILSLSADYTYNTESGSNAQGQTNGAVNGTRSTFRVGSSVAFRWSPLVLYGLETALTRTSGSSTGATGVSANVNSINIGPFIRGALSRLTDFDLSCGATLLDAKPSVPPTYYLSAVLRHQFNRDFQLILSGSHDLVFTTGTNITEESVFQASTQFNLTRFITFTASPSLLLGDSRITPNQAIQNGLVRGNFKEYVFEAGLRWKPRRHLSAALTYDFRRRDAETPTGSYSQNRIIFEIKYLF